MQSTPPELRYSTTPKQSGEMRSHQKQENVKRHLKIPTDKGKFVPTVKRAKAQPLDTVSSISCNMNVVIQSNCKSCMCIEAMLCSSDVFARTQISKHIKCNIQVPLSCERCSKIQAGKSLKESSGHFHLPYHRSVCTTQVDLATNFSQF